LPRTRQRQRLRIIALRQQKGLSRTQLAYLAGVEYATVERFEQGRSVPGVATLRGIAQALGISLDELVQMLEQDDAGTA
jgi:transcriptional regulator with XRE-family HTH domain